MEMKKPSFLGQAHPLLCAMVQDSTPDEMICTILDSLYDGAEAFGIQLCNLKSEYRTEDTLRKIFSYCDGKPIYITSYRGAESKGLTDDERAELLLLGLRAGATLCDVMGDYFHPEKDQLTFDTTAIEKQKVLIDRIHENGGEVLISTHTSRYFTEEEVVSYAKEQMARGADVVKIVSKAETEDQQMAALSIIHRLKKECDRPFLFLVGGKYTRLVRQIGPALGVCMYLCVQRYRPVTAKPQPILRAVKTIRDNMLL